MLYLDYAKPLADGKYILSFFADSAEDLESISHGQKFVTKNGTDYGVPQAGSTVIVTSPTSGKTTYVMDAEGIWVVTEDISYSAVVVNPSDEATAKLEKLKVNDTTYANWTESEIKALAGEKLYLHYVYCHILQGSNNYFRFSLTARKNLPTNLLTYGTGIVLIENKCYPCYSFNLSFNYVSGTISGIIQYVASDGTTETINLTSTKFYDITSEL